MISVPNYSLQMVQRGEVQVPQDTVKDLRDAAAVASAMIGACQEEHAILLYVGKFGKVRGAHIVGVGNSHSVGIEPRTIVRAALLEGCDQFVLAHNHPDGDPTPSRPDIEFTESLVEILNYHGILMMGHIVVTDDPTKWARVDRRPNPEAEILRMLENLIVSK